MKKFLNTISLLLLYFLLILLGLTFTFSGSALAALIFNIPFWIGFLIFVAIELIYLFIMIKKFSITEEELFKTKDNDKIDCD